MIKEIFLWLLLISCMILLMIGFSNAQLTGITPIIKETTKEIPIYELKETKTKYDCYDNITAKIVKDYCQSVTYETIISGYKTKTKTEIIGYTKDGKDIKGITYNDNGIIIVWDYPIGDRNFKEFPKCRDHEKSKGICHEI